MNLILFGPPGSGKGTQAGYLVERRGYKHLSTGDLFRDAIRRETPLGVRIKTIVQSGELVPDEVVSQVVREAVRETQRPGIQYLFDGFPRTLCQVGHLEQILADQKIRGVLALALDVDDAEVIKRISARRSCRSCSAVYNLVSQPPARADVCDRCGGPLFQRADDNESVIGERLRVYREQTQPVLEAYQRQGALHSIPGSGAPEEILGRILKILDAHAQ